MKDPYMIMSLLILGPKVPGNDIDMYLQPLVDNLKELWIKGILMYDVSKHENFKLHATLLWTINDFRAYGNLSGWSTKGKLACLVYNNDTMFRRLKFGFKMCYMGHRRFLPQGHIWHKKKSLFDGTDEHRMKSNELFGDQLLHQLKNVTNVQFGKDENGKTRKRKRKENELNWRINSFFFFFFFKKNKKICLIGQH
jgi:hypothetical protein